MSAAAGLFLGPAMLAQQHPEPMGSVATRDARVSGGLEVQGDTAQLLTNVGVTAYDRDATVTLRRGGRVLVCSTSEFHLLHSGTSGSLIFGLDRGAIEVNTDARMQDAVLTPDLKLTLVTKGVLDLKLRVTREGDTCIDNAGGNAPVLNVTDPFSSASYRVLPGQHLLFIKGDLHKVVDHERNSCGCPPAVAPRQLAGIPGQPATAAQAAAAHPFPEAQSADLAPATNTANEAPVGTASSQVSTSFSYGADESRPPIVDATPAVQLPGNKQGKPVPDATRGGFGTKLRRFFYNIFHPGQKGHAP